MSNKPARLVIFLILIAVESFLAFLWMLSIPGDKSNALLLGLSLRRWLLAMFPLVFSLLTVAGLLVLALNREIAIKWAAVTKSLAKGGMAAPFLFLLSISALILLVLGHIELGLSPAVMQRLAPVLVLVWLGFAQAGIFILIGSERRPSGAWGYLWKPVLASLCVILVLAGVSALVGVQEALSSPYASGSGAPLLPKQVLISLYAASAYACVEQLFKKLPFSKTVLPTVTALLIFSLAAWVWMEIPIPETHFSISSNLGDGAVVLYSDAFTYDVNAQKMRMGLGLAAGAPLPRPLYSFFLGILHLLLGADISAAINAQTVVLAMVPALIYLLGRKNLAPSAGILAAFLFIYRETNQAILSDVYTLSSVRMLMSEFFTIVFIILLIVVATGWLKFPTSRTSAAMTGVLLGLTALIRSQVLVFLPLLVLWGLLALLRNQRGWRQATLWLVGGLLLVVLPWMGRNALRNGAFTFEDPAYSSRTLVVATGKGENVSVVTAALENPLAYLLTTVSYFANNALSSLYQLPWVTNLDENLDSHFTNNPSPRLYPPLNLQAGQMAVVMLHLGLVAFGLAGAWQAGGLTGVLPFGIYLSYAVSSSLARYSGWRFILPVDWIILLYWALGVISVVQSISLTLGQTSAGAITREASKPTREWRPASILTVALMAGLLMPLGESLVPKRLETLDDRSAILQKISVAAAPQEIQNLVLDPAARLAYGMLYNPIYINDDRIFNRLQITSPLVQTARPLLRFHIVSRGNTVVYLPVNDMPNNFPNTLPVVAVGCDRDNHFFAAAVLIEGSEPYWLVSSQKIPRVCAE